MTTTAEPSAPAAAPPIETVEPTAIPPTPGIPIPPDPLGYRLKNKLLGPPLHTEQLEHERLGKPTALAVFASDNLSSSAYATEEILRVLIPAIGIGAFALVTPITGALLVVLGFLILSYRQTIKAYPSAGGAYMVTRDNFGILPAQVAGVALLTDYILTVSVSVAAGSAALASAFPAFEPYILPISVVFVIVIAFGNLRGVKESGRIFAIPTYFFIANMGILLAVGAYKFATGSLATVPHAAGMLPFGKSLDGALFMGASLYVVMHAFASGGAAVTGVEAISNGVPAFRKPEWKNARSTLVVMGTLLGIMFLGLSLLAAHMHPVPYETGTPTVISQIGDYVYGSGIGRVFFFALQAGTMLILVLAANTSFADFPRLASFHAGDNFMPRQLTKRGHRLVFSNGIIFLSVCAIVLLLVTDAKVDRLIPLYAIGVFTSFTLSQAGMAKHHIREKEKGWRWGLFVNGVGAFLSFVVLVVVGITKFTHGAWAIIVLVPILVVFLFRLARQYEREDAALGTDVPEAITAPVRRRLVVMVFVDRLDLAVARAIQFGRTLRPDELQAVHFAVDHDAAKRLADDWRIHGLANLPIEIIDCPDRRLSRSAVETVARTLATGDTEVCVLLPERMYNGVWNRILHDQTAESLARAVSRMPHANVTSVPFHFEDRKHRKPSHDDLGAALAAANAGGDAAAAGATDGHRADGSIAMSEVRCRVRAKVTGRVQSVRVRPLSGSPRLELTLADATGAVTVTFLGRQEISGMEIGTTMTIEGMPADHNGRLTFMNPTYELIAPAHPAH